MDRPRQARSPEDWSARQRTFWDAVAEDYTGLYKDGWSQAEDAEVIELLRELIQPGDTVVDLGCGQGLALHLLKRAGVAFGAYFGLDISKSMLDLAKRPARSTEVLVQADMGAIPVLDASVSVAMSVYSSISYVEDPESVIREISRILVPNGRYLIMCISRWSLRRVVRLKLGHKESYGTGLLTASHACPAPVRVVSKSQLSGLLRSYDLAVTSIFGQSAFRLTSGLEVVWSISSLVGKVLPNLGHCLVVSGFKIPSD